MSHRNFVGREEQLELAVLMLHEQAHHGPIRTCMAEPCRELGLDHVGPAPLSLPAESLEVGR